MTFHERFPACQQSTWPVTAPGYRPNEVLTAQPCQECHALVDWHQRQVHSNWHDQQAAVLDDLLLAVFGEDFELPRRVVDVDTGGRL